MPDDNVACGGVNSLCTSVREFHVARGVFANARTGAGPGSRNCLPLQGCVINKCSNAKDSDVGLQLHIGACVFETVTMGRRLCPSSLCTCAEAGDGDKAMEIDS